jgi:hypothetical protein
MRILARAAAELGPDLTRIAFKSVLESRGWDSGFGVTLYWPRGDHNALPYSFNRQFIYRWVGHPDRAREAYRAAAAEARRLGDPVLLAQAALGMGEVSAVWGVDEELVGLLEAALTALGDRAPAPALASRLLARLAQALYYTDRDRCLELSDQAVKEAREGGDPVALAVVLRARHVALSGPDDPAGRCEVASEIVRLAEAAGEPELALQGRAWRLVDLLELGDLDGVDAEMTIHGELAQALRQPLHLRDAMWRAMRAALTGHFDEAERQIELAYALGCRGEDPWATVMRSTQRGLLAYIRGRPDDLAPIVDEWRELGRDYPTALAWRAGVAFLATGAGRPHRLRVRGGGRPRIRHASAGRHLAPHTRRPG